MREHSATDRDKHLLERASATVEYPRLTDLIAEVLQEITAKHGIDFATALLYDRAINSKDHGPAITRLNELRQRQQHSQPAKPPQATFVIVPGAFYQEFPATGADGRLLREQAEKQGYRTATVPVTSTGTLSSNAKAICDWLDGQPDEKVVLASVSKGGSDVKTALSSENAAHIFRNVVAWINVGGILDGSPMVNWLLSRRVRTLFYRSVFWLRGYDFRVIRDMRWGPGSLLDFELELPEHMKMFSVVGFPLTEHMTNRLSRSFRNRIASLGPNDGSVMLADAFKVPGVIYPAWGADHYMRPGWELRTVADALLQYVAEDLSLFETPETQPLKFACG